MLALLEGTPGGGIGTSADGWTVLSDAPSSITQEQYTSFPEVRAHIWPFSEIAFTSSAFRSGRSMSVPRYQLRIAGEDV